MGWPTASKYRQPVHNRSWFTRPQLARVLTLAAVAAWPVFIVAVAVLGGR